MGLRIPIVPLRTLELQAARSDTPVIAISEAGRGRLYYLAPGARPALGEPKEFPKTHRLAEFVSAATGSPPHQAAHRLGPQRDLPSSRASPAPLADAAPAAPHASPNILY